MLNAADLEMLKQTVRDRNDPKDIVIRDLIATRSRGFENEQIPVVLGVLEDPTPARREASEPLDVFAMIDQWSVSR